MRTPSYFLLALFAVITSSFAQPARIELLSRSDDHERRVGSSAMAGVAEFSRDGNYVLFLSEASNLTTNKPAGKPVLNLFMTDWRTGETTLLSQGADGDPANENVVNFELSADNQRVLIETAASNLISDDTNNAVDVFVRDLALKTNILVSANTNGNVTRRGGQFATMSGDGKFVAFRSSDRSFATNQSTSVLQAYVRDLAAGKNMVVTVPGNITPFSYRDLSLSDDGRYLAFLAFLTTTTSSDEYHFIWDRQTEVSTIIGEDIKQNSEEPFLTPDGKFVVFSKYHGFFARTNVIGRYSVESGHTDLVVSNTLATTTRTIAISDNARTILYFEENGYRVYREGAETRAFPRGVDGMPMKLPSLFGMAELSANGRIVTFLTDVPLLPEHDDTGEYRTYVYDVEADVLSALPIASPTPPTLDPVPNADGSLVLFTAADRGFQDESEPAAQNIYLWERASGNLRLLSKAHAGAFENSDKGHSKLAEFDSISDDGTKVVYTSSAAATGVSDTNATLDVFVLDRITGRKELVSVSADGGSTGSAPSYSPVISGNGRMVAFLSRATNLVNLEGFWVPQLFVRDLQTGTTRMITNTNGAPTRGGYVRGWMSFDRQGSKLAFVGGIDVDPRNSRSFQQVNVYDVASGAVSMVSYDATGTAGGNNHSSEPVISPDGKFVAFRSTASDLGISGGGVYVRDLTTGTLKRPTSPNGGSAFNVARGKLLFDPASTTLFYGATGAVYQAYNVAQNTQARLATRAVETSVSTNQQWVAFSRQFTGVFPLLTQIILRDALTGTETIVSSNRTTGAVGNSNSTRPKISPDGRFVIFQSRASNLVENDTNECADIFMYERETQRLHLISRAWDRTAASRASLRPVMSPDNSFVAFISYASNIAEHDYNMDADIFAAHLPSPDTDSDSIDDRWETNYFESLTHDMAGDADGDGLTDAMEFAAGTDPEASSSTVRVVSAAVGNENFVVRWLSVPGRNYRVQARASFDAQSQWQDLSDTIVASRTVMEITLPAFDAAEELYFRIVSVP